MKKHRMMLLALAMVFAGTGLPAVAQSSGEVTMRGDGVFDANRIYSGVVTISGALSDEGTAVDTPLFSGVGAVHITRVMTMSGGEQITLSINASHVTPGDRPSTCPRPPGSNVSGTAGSWTIESATGRYAQLRGSGRWEAWVTLDANGPRAAQDCLSGRVQGAP